MTGMAPGSGPDGIPRGLSAWLGMAGMGPVAFPVAGNRAGWRPADPVAGKVPAPLFSTSFSHVAG